MRPLTLPPFEKFWTCIWKNLVKANCLTQRGKCHKKDEDALEEVDTGNIFTSNETSQIFHNIEGAKSKVLGADPSIETIMKIHQGMEKMLSVYGKR